MTETRTLENAQIDDDTAVTAIRPNPRAEAETDEVEMEERTLNQYSVFESESEFFSSSASSYRRVEHLTVYIRDGDEERYVPVVRSDWDFDWDIRKWVHPELDGMELDEDSRDIDHNKSHRNRRLKVHRKVVEEFEEVIVFKTYTNVYGSRSRSGNSVEARRAVQLITE